MTALVVFHRWNPAPLVICIISGCSVVNFYPFYLVSFLYWCRAARLFFYISTYWQLEFFHTEHPDFIVSELEVWPTCRSEIWLQKSQKSIEKLWKKLEKQSECNTQKCHIYCLCKCKHCIINKRNCYILLCSTLYLSVLNDNSIVYKQQHLYNVCVIDLFSAPQPTLTRLHPPVLSPPLPHKQPWLHWWFV